LFEMVAPPLKVDNPVKVLIPETRRSLLTVVVPVVAPKEIVVASPPMDRLVTVVLNSVAVPVVEVISADTAPLTARSAPNVTLPVNVDVPSMVRFPLACMFPVFDIDTPDVP